MCMRKWHPGFQHNSQTSAGNHDDLRHKFQSFGKLQKFLQPRSASSWLMGSPLMGTESFARAERGETPETHYQHFSGFLITQDIKKIVYWWNTCLIAQIHCERSDIIPGRLCSEGGKAIVRTNSSEALKTLRADIKGGIKLMTNQKHLSRCFSSSSRWSRKPASGLYHFKL